MIYTGYDMIDQFHSSTSRIYRSFKMSIECSPVVSITFIQKFPVSKRLHEEKYFEVIHYGKFG